MIGQAWVMGVEEGCDWLAPQNHADLGKAIWPKDGSEGVKSEKGNESLVDKDYRCQLLMAQHCPKGEIYTL